MTSSRTGSTKATDDLTTKYARLVAAGKIVAGKWVRLACERHLYDLKAAHARGLRFDAAAARRAIRFFGFLKHSKGEWAGLVFELGLWQCFIVGSLFGWKRADGTRRFRQALTEVARKNGKTTLMAAIGLMLFVADGEPGAEVYTAATKRDQARITHSEAGRMVKRSATLRRRIKKYKDNLSIEETASKYEPLGADADTMDGLNVHGGLIDELHAHKTRDVVDVLETATGARRQPLIFEITTAGQDQESIWREHHDYSLSVLQGTVVDDSWFAYIATIDEGDDWTDPKVWVKANPNLGVSVKLEDMRRQCAKAQQLPAAQNAFLRLRLDVPTQQVSRWVDLGLWDENAQNADGSLHPLDDAHLKGRAFCGGLDLSSVSDMTAWVKVFAHEDDPDEIDVLAHFWVPSARLNDTGNRYRDQYRAWVRMGALQVIEGNAIDYRNIKAQVLADVAAYKFRDLGIDRLFQAHQLAVELAEELGEDRVFGMGMGFISMAAPMHDFERRLLSRKIRHGGQPVLRWMIESLAVRQDPAGNYKPDKAASQGKIDGVVGLVIALDRLMRHEEPRGLSLYVGEG